MFKQDYNVGDLADDGPYFRNLCKRCFCNRLGDNGRGELTCFSCGLVQGTVFESTPEWWEHRLKTYKRVFYFNERCSRWLCNEPSISEDSWTVINEAALLHKKSAEIQSPGHFDTFDRGTICKILKSVRLTNEFMKRNQSKKFKKTLMTKKRFYDKYSEKWKSIIWRLTKKQPKIPPVGLVEHIKGLFAACQKPFEIHRHARDCDKRHECDKYFDCWHNFLNYDFIFRKLLQIAELKFGWKGCYSFYKDEFLLVSKRVRDAKLRPLFLKICNYNAWPCPADE
jgi:hypothetical protein